MHIMRHDAKAARLLGLAGFMSIEVYENEVYGSSCVSAGKGGCIEELGKGFDHC